MKQSKIFLCVSIFIVSFALCLQSCSALVEIKLYTDFKREDIYDSVCIKVFEHSGCKGKYITFRAAHHKDSEYLDNLRELGFNDVISSVSPCSLQIEDGRYVLQNLGDNKMLTVVDEGIYAKVYSKYWKNLNTQHWEVTQLPGSDILYEMLPAMYQNHIEKPVVYDKRDFQTLKEYKKIKPTFLIESVDDWKYVIREARSKLCLTTGRKDEITLHACHFNSKGQQWIFRVSG